nr:FkbM family methyltransferase [Chthoniobacterales bacterium]
LRGYRWRAGASNHGCWLGSYEQEKQKLFASSISLGSVVYDIGANVGFYTLLASELVGDSGRVIAFEPLPRNLSLLRDHIHLNNLRNVQVIEAAVADRIGDAMFDDQRNPSMGQLSESGRIEVRTVALDDLVESETIPPPDFIKIDVEGAEGGVLKGAERVLLRQQPTIFLATHGDNAKWACLNLLNRYKYSVQPIGHASVANSDEFLAVALTSA